MSADSGMYISRGDAEGTEMDICNCTAGDSEICVFWEYYPQISQIYADFGEGISRGDAEGAEIYV